MKIKDAIAGFRPICNNIISCDMFNEEFDDINEDLQYSVMSEVERSEFCISAFIDYLSINNITLEEHEEP